MRRRRFTPISHTRSDYCVFASLTRQQISLFAGNHQSPELVTNGDSLVTVLRQGALRSAGALARVFWERLLSVSVKFAPLRDDLFLASELASSPPAPLLDVEERGARTGGAKRSSVGVELTNSPSPPLGERDRERGPFKASHFVVLRLGRATKYQTQLRFLNICAVNSCRCFDSVSVQVHPCSSVVDAQKLCILHQKSH
jgi:hypothetical protein